LARAVEGVETKDLKSLVDDGKKQIGSAWSRSSAVTEDARPALWSASPPISPRLQPVDLVKIASATLGGKAAAAGPTWRRAGGPDGAKADAALSAIEKAMAGA